MKKTSVGLACMAVLFSSGFGAVAQVVFFDDFQQFTNGANLTLTNYTPASGPAGAVVTTSIENGSPTCIASNFLGSTMAFFDNSAVPNKGQYRGSLSQIQTNQVLMASWKLWIQATNSGPGYFLFSIPVSDPNADFNPPVFFTDSGSVAALTNGNTSQTSIGEWGSLAGTIMTNRLVLNFPNRAFSFSINGQILAVLPLGSYFSNRVNAVYFNPLERSSASLGNRFALDDIKVELLPITPTITAINKTGTNALVRFTTLPGGRYSVETRDDLRGGTWTTLTNNITGTGDTLQVFDGGISGATSRFYRVVKTF